MQQLFSTKPNTKIEDNFKPIVLETFEIQDLSEEFDDFEIDISTASIEELSSIVVSNMIKVVRKNLADVKVANDDSRRAKG